MKNIFFLFHDFTVAVGVRDSTENRFLNFLNTTKTVLLVVVDIAIT
jgi:hypothetical protein